MGQRYMALFFVSLFWVSMLIVPASVARAVALEQLDSQTQIQSPAKDELKKAPTDQHVKPLDMDANTKQEKFSAPNAMATVQSKNKPAADYTDRSPGSLPGALGNIKKEQPRTITPGLMDQPKSKKQTKEELTDKRTANSSTFRNPDGSYTTKQYYAPKFFKKSGKWESISTKLVEDKNAGDSGNVFGRVLGHVESWASSPTTFTVEDNDWQARFAPSGAAEGMVRIKKGDSQISFSPVGAKDIAPVVTTDDQGVQTVHYYDLWPGVNVEYTVHSAEVKEYIVIKNKNATNKVQFQIGGASLKKANSEKGGPDFTIEGALDNEFAIAPVNLILNNFGLETDHSVFSQKYENGKLTIQVEKEYLAKLPSKAFPAVIDPTTVRRSDFGTRAGGNYISYKSDGYICYSNECNLYAGSLLDVNSVWRTWRGEFFANYEFIKGRQLDYARLHLKKRTGVSFYTGTDNAYAFSAWRSDCHSYTCVRGGSWSGEATFSQEGDINATSIYQNAQAANDWGAWVMVLGTEGSSTTFKNFDPEGTFVEFTYTDILPSPRVLTPTTNQVFTDPQVSFTSTTHTHPVNGGALSYNFCVSSGPSCNGAVMISGAQTSSQWTVPDNLLQDGSTYYIQVQSYDPATGVYSSYGPAVPFKIDARTGKDSTQAYDTLGPVSVDLATGNMTTGAASHSSSALGGSLGIGLDYNSPVRSRNGLVGEYFNNTNRSGSPAITRVDPQVDFSWQTGTPASNVINTDNVSAKWTGYFVAPKAGTYYFGANNDDSMTITVNSTQIYNNSYCSTLCYGTNTITLTEGQVVPITIEYTELTGNATARVYVKGAVGEQVIPSQWLQTGVRDTAQQYGLVGRYYKDNGNHDFTDSSNTMFMQRNDPLVSFAWEADGAAPGAQTDNFMARWTGYITVPANGTYDFGTVGDDGTRVTVNGAQVVNKWYDDGNTPVWGGGIALTGGVSVPITIDYFEHGGGATIYLKVRNTGQTNEQVVPTTWLTPKAMVLPNGWNMGLDADGNVSYDRLRVSQNSVILTDSTGSTHEYVANGGSYTPPVNESGNLTRNNDGTYTFQDSDGRTYVFNADGTLSSVTSPVDDQAPAALQYTYGGTPSKLTQITDGVTNTRWAKVFYSGDTGCGTAPATFDTQAPANMLCAVKTNDGRATYFYYKSAKLSRIQAPGNELTDYQYDNYGRIISVREPLANDAIGAGMRADNAEAKNEIEYDNLGRVSKVTQPAPTAGTTRAQHTLEYKPGGTKRWGDTQKLEAAVGSTPVSVSWGPARIDMFARGAGNDLVHKWYDNGKWSDWESLGGCIMNDPAATTWGYGRLDVFVMGCNTTGSNIHMQTYTVNGGWSGWYQPTGGFTTSSPSAVSWSPGRIDLFVRNANNALSHIGFDNSAWASWEDLGGCLSDAPAATSWGSLRLDVFVRDCSSSGANLNRISWSPVGWTGYSLVGTDRITGGIGATSVEPGTIEVLTRNASSDLQHRSLSPAGTWSTPQTITGCTSTGTIPFLSKRGSVVDLFYKGCETSGNNLYQKPLTTPTGTTLQHVPGSAEPNGFSRKIEYDQLFRTVADTDITNLTDLTEWEAGKDKLLSTTDETGLKSTAIYDDFERPVTKYGPAPAAWFGPDRKPLSTYASQVPRTDTAFDEGVQGPNVAYYALNADTKTLTGAPKLHTTNLAGATSGDLNRYFGVNSPMSGISSNWGFRATGKLRLPASGNYTFRVWSDNGVRLYIDDQLVLDDWNPGVQRSHPLVGFQNEANSVHRFTLEYYHLTGDANLTFYMTPPGGSEFYQGVNQYISPGYNLATSSKTYDSTLGDMNMTTNYGSNPELGLAQSVTVDPSGANLTANLSYETQGASGSFLRKTNARLPGNTSGNPTATYTYYSAADTRDNPCTTGSTETFKQAGRLKFAADASPDGGTTAGIKGETIYDDAGRIVANRSNSDSWTCNTYDSRGRMSVTSMPAFNGEAARTVNYDYAVGGNPLITTTWDENGWIVKWTDLLGRTVTYRDAHDDETNTTYDQFGRMTQRVSPIGTEAFVYDSYNRMTTQKLDNVTYATVSYNQYNRVDHIDYSNAGQLRLTPGSDSMLRPNAVTYRMGNGTTTLTDTANYTQSGRVQNEIVSSGGSDLWSTYGYDGAGRLTSANTGPHTFSYGFGTQNSSCGAGANMNANSGKNGNRTTQTINGVTTYYCYDYADRLVSSNEATANYAEYDPHGNMTYLGTGAKPLRMCYDSTDRNYCAVNYNSSGTGDAVYYGRDAADRLTYREHNTITAWNWNMDQQYWYGYTGEGGSSSFMRNANWDIVEKTLHLPGGALMTIYPQQTGNNQKQYSFQSVLGRTLMTTNAAGANTSSGNGPLNSFTYDPFGNALTGSVLPANTTGGSYGFGGTLQKLTETSLVMKPIQMGARLYLSTLGRFAAVDPVPGGSVNAYAYALDPINFSDYSGKCILQCTANVSFLQPAAAVQYVQPAPNISRVQNASTRPLQARATQPVVPRPTVRPPATPVVYPVATIGIDMSKIKNTTWAGVPVPAKPSLWNRVTSGTQSVLGNQYVKAGSQGCVEGVAGGLILAGAVAAGTGQVEISGAMIAYDCTVGAMSGVADTMMPGSGNAIDSVDMSFDVYDIYKRFLR